MRVLLLFLPVVLAGCVSNMRPVSQREVLKQSQVEIARRESWSPRAAVFVDDTGDFVRRTWVVRAGEFDFSEYPHYTGIHFVHGTERELVFDGTGCLISYENISNPCLTSGGTGGGGEFFLSSEK